MRVAIHQPNFVPWLPFFYKMAMVDNFVLLTNVQFEKNGYQNRFKYKDKWITKPVNSGLENISIKRYADGNNLAHLNKSWIDVIARTLGIETNIRYDIKIDTDCSTQRLIDLVKMFDGQIYVTNESAKDKYLDEEKMKSQGIEIDYCKVPKQYQISIFEAFEVYGIEHLTKMLKKVKNENSERVLQGVA